MKMAKDVETRRELEAAAKKYDAMHNDGGEGYNPYRDEIDRRDSAAANQPETLEARRDNIAHQLDVIDCSLARSVDPNNADKVAALRVELEDVDRLIDDAFLAAWPHELTAERRAEWNGRIRHEAPGDGDCERRWLRDIEAEQGWTLRDLQRAVKLWDAKGVANV